MTNKSEILHAVREKCRDCSCYQPQEIKLCPIHRCALYPYRCGVDPNPSPSRGFAKSRGYTGENQQGEDK